MPHTKSLWVKTDKQIAALRATLLEEQKGLDPILNEPVHGVACLDHDHFDGRVRGVVSQCVNTFEGQVLKAWMKYVSPYTETSLSTALRNLADYLEQDTSDKHFHGKHMDTMKTTVKKWSSETIRRKSLEDFGVEIDESLDKTETVRAYMTEFIKQVEEDLWQTNYPS